MVYTKSTWNGFERLDFELNGREAILILPEKFPEICCRSFIFALTKVFCRIILMPTAY